MGSDGDEFRSYWVRQRRRWLLSAGGAVVAGAAVLPIGLLDHDRTLVVVGVCFIVLPPLLLLPALVLAGRLVRGEIPVDQQRWERGIRRSRAVSAWTHLFVAVGLISIGAIGSVTVSIVAAWPVLLIGLVFAVSAVRRFRKLAG